MGSEPIATALDVDEGDLVAFGTDQYVRERPYEVVEAGDVIAWEAPTGDTWPTRRLAVHSTFRSTAPAIPVEVLGDEIVAHESTAPASGNEVTLFERVEDYPEVDDDPDYGRLVHPPIEAHDETVMDTRATILQETCLAVGVEPTDNGDPTKRVARDVVARITDWPTPQFATLQKDELWDELTDHLDVDEDWGSNPVKDQLRVLHGAVVPERRLDGPVEWADADELVETPGWVIEAEYDNAINRASSLREAARFLSWDDIDELRRLTWLLGDYEELDQPEAKPGSKYAVADGGGRDRR